MRTKSNLAELRVRQGVTQVALAEALGVNQGQISAIERRDDHRISTVRRYVEALGGQLQLVVVVGHREFLLE